MIATTKDKILTKLAARRMTTEALAKAIHRPAPTVRRNCGELAREGKLERSAFKNGTPTTWTLAGVRAANGSNGSKKQNAVEASPDSQPSAPSVGGEG